MRSKKLLFIFIVISLMLISCNAPDPNTEDGKKEIKTKVVTEKVLEFICEIPPELEGKITVSTQDTIEVYTCEDAPHYITMTKGLISTEDTVTISFRVRNFQ